MPKNAYEYVHECVCQCECVYVSDAYVFEKGFVEGAFLEGNHF